MSCLRRWRGALAAAGIALLLLAGAQLLLHWLAPPAFDRVRAAYTPSSAFLLDRHGEVLDAQRVSFGARRSTWTALDEVSPALIAALVAGEDHRYWRHAGVDLLGLASALRDWIAEGRHRGASTISMQLITLLEGSRSARGSPGLGAKLRQMARAVALERRWNKRQILEAYVNLLQFRGELQGIGAVSETLAHKAPSGLSSAEAAVLAALLPSPAADADRISRRACARRRGIGHGSDCADLDAAATALLVRAGSGAQTERLAPQLAAALLREPGRNVRTTLDAGIQRLTRDALAHQLEGLQDRNVRDGAALVVDNETGEVLAYVGSAGPASHSPQVDGVRAPRQAGSTLKPFLYQLAIERRYLTAASLIDDAPINVDTASGIYLPQDYEHVQLGPVSVRTALGGSLNLPAVRTLMLVGVDAFIDRLRALGFRGIDRDGAYYGYSLALGSAEVSLWEQAQAYRSLAQGGRFAPLRLRADLPAASETRVLQAGAGFIVASVLSDPAARAVTFGLDNSLATSYWSAVKTGTSKDMRDNWCIGFTSRYTVAVWVGNFEGDAMRGVSGITGAAPAWREIQDGLRALATSVTPAPPADVVQASVRYATAEEPARVDWFLRGTVPAGSIRHVEAADQITRIGAPVNGMVIALDPDIPASRQRVPVRVLGAREEFNVRLDGTLLGSAAHALLWEPRPGAHRLALEDGNGRVLDRSLFTVR